MVHGINRITLGDQVYEKLRSMIFLNEIPQGSRLNESELGRLLNVSPTPIREAINRLGGDGLVETNSWKGSYVREFSDKDIVDITELRLVIESISLERSIGRVTAQDLEFLHKKNKEYVDVFAVPGEIDLNQAIKTNTDFHLFFARKFGNRWILEILEQLTNYLHLARAPITRQTDGLKTFEEHAAILAAVERQDGQAALEGLRYHLTRVKADLERIRVGS